MKTACQTQCPQCPFRSTSLPGWLGSYDGPGGIHTSLWHKNPFFCHTRTNYERPDWRERAMVSGKLCTGALIFVGRDEWFPKPEDPEIQSAIQWAMAQYTAHPEQFDVMQGRAFMDHHQQAWLDGQARAQRYRDVARTYE